MLISGWQAALEALEEFKSTATRAGAGEGASGMRRKSVVPGARDAAAAAEIQKLRTQLNQHEVRSSSATPSSSSITQQQQHSALPPLSITTNQQQHHSALPLLGTTTNQQQHHSALPPLIARVIDVGVLLQAAVKEQFKQMSWYNPQSGSTESELGKLEPQVHTPMCFSVGCQPTILIE